ncbi:hypothetical protein VNO78_30424 [Psophocarpus tetragonolobus]|uniref:Uncharacterized protein n=1 Tax=Psophocarpus tetragonolobus TaxID=3891 RepID=A0AAN9RXB2_PSOTE
MGAESKPYHASGDEADEVRDWGFGGGVVDRVFDEVQDGDDKELAIAGFDFGSVGGDEEGFEVDKRGCSEEWMRER